LLKCAAEEPRKARADKVRTRTKTELGIASGELPRLLLIERSGMAGHSG
jgi:hypothetical protein